MYVQMHNAGVWLFYELNKSDIIANFCENLDKPELKCEGTCHMKKMMVDEAGSTDQVPPSTIPEMLLFVSDLPNQEMNSNEISILYTPYQDQYVFEFLNDWEDPPKI